MAKRKRKDSDSTETQGDAQEPVSGGSEPSEFEFPPREAEQGSADNAGQQHADPAAPQPAVKKVHGVYGRYLSDRRVELIDDGNAGGIGIKLSYDDPAERPSDEIKRILKEGDEKRPGFSYRGDLKQWRKRVGTDADARTAVAIRMDAERRVDAIGEQMSHEERLKAERAEGADQGQSVPS